VRLPHLVSLVVASLLLPLLFPSKKAIHFLHCIAVHLWQRMPVDIQRSADVAVPEYLLCHFRRNPHAQKDSSFDRNTDVFCRFARGDLLPA
jgi:hypothetical protein